ncbi:TorD/DmsD family molecular chaperone [Hippea maritima]|uniref:Cytoplasmic chaperone TorD family protein n=1 Tax=Hippea maritima (strain ATCC 700847 / DSM 10411 / MH2) TaxID=760142 RepID=F2LUE5_HIPMA|nr:molecular chaperone TorD family protein [Hippea maritima]AEA33471.1 cytoplasmic chaperone TorD family protein [Hippea maritima DSM 10411]
MKDDRIAMYRFLSICFTYPEENFSEVIQKAIQMIKQSYTNLNENGYKLTGIRNLKQGLKEMEKLSLHQWQGVYTGLFIANFPKTPFHPYESFYKDGLVGGEVSDQLNEVYKSCGLEIFDEREFPDYLPFELEFGAFLLENEEACKPAFAEFFFDHLFSWVFNFFDDLNKDKKVPLFYRSLSQIGTTFLTKEQKVLKELLNEN